MGLGDIMAMENKICPECGKKFHACDSCGLEHDYEYKYCSKDCFKKSLEYEQNVRRLISLIVLCKKDISELESLIDFIDDTIRSDIQIYLSNEEIRDCWYN